MEEKQDKEEISLLREKARAAQKEEEIKVLQQIPGNPDLFIPAEKEISSEKSVTVTEEKEEPLPDFDSLTLEDFQWLAYGKGQIPPNTLLIAYVTEENQLDWKIISNGKQAKKNETIVKQNKQFIHAFLSILKESYSEQAVNHSITRMLYTLGYREKNYPNIKEGKFFLTKKGIQQILEELQDQQQTEKAYKEGQSVQHNETQNFYNPYAFTYQREACPAPWVSAPHTQRNQTSYFHPPSIYPQPLLLVPASFLHQRVLPPPPLLIPPLPPPSNNNSFRPAFPYSQQLHLQQPFTDSFSGNKSLRIDATEFKPGHFSPSGSSSKKELTLTSSDSSFVSQKEEIALLNDPGEVVLRSSAIKRELSDYLDRQKRKIQQKEFFNLWREYLNNRKKDKTLVKQIIEEALLENVEKTNEQKRTDKESKREIFKHLKNWVAKHKENNELATQIIEKIQGEVTKKETFEYLKDWLVKRKENNELATQTIEKVQDEVTKKQNFNSWKEYSNNRQEDKTLVKQIIEEALLRNVEKAINKKNKKERDRLPKLWGQVVEELLKEPTILPDVKKEPDLSDPERIKQYKRLIALYCKETALERYQRLFNEGVEYYRAHPQEAFNNFFNKHPLPPTLLLNAFLALQDHFVFGPKSSVDIEARALPFIVANGIVAAAYWKNIINYLGEHPVVQQAMDYQNRYGGPMIEEVARATSPAFKKFFMNPANPYFLQLAAYGTALAVLGKNASLTQLLLAMSIGHTFYFFTKAWPEYKAWQEQPLRKQDNAGKN